MTAALVNWMSSGNQGNSGIVRHLPRAPPRVPSAEQASEKSRHSRAREVVIDHNAQPSARGAWRQFESHAVATDHQEPRLARCLPALPEWRLALDHDFVEVQADPKDPPVSTSALRRRGEPIVQRGRDSNERTNIRAEDSGTADKLEDGLRPRVSSTRPITMSM